MKSNLVIQLLIQLLAIHSTSTMNRNSWHFGPIEQRFESEKQFLKGAFHVT